MGRKSKRMALYEAIRQGQAKIAQGLENGQMRSDGMGQQKAQKPIAPLSGSRPRLVAQSALFESKETSQGFLSSPTTVKIAMAGGAVLIVLLVVWLLSLIFGGDEPVQPTAQQPAEPIRQTQPTEPVRAAENTVPPVEEQKEEKKTGIFGFGKKEPKEEEAAPVQPAEPTFESSIGKNVIVIASIPGSRQNELSSLKEFFAVKGVPTEVIMNSSGYAMLVTRQGFDKNPASEGTDGYRLLQKIKQLGLVYPNETGDTKWGVRPFQEAWGYKRTK